MGIALKSSSGGGAPSAMASECEYHKAARVLRFTTRVSARGATLWALHRQTLGPEFSSASTNGVRCGAPTRSEYNIFVFRYSSLGALICSARPSTLLLYTRLQCILPLYLNVTGRVAQLLSSCRSDYYDRALSCSGGAKAMAMQHASAPGSVLTRIPRPTSDHRLVVCPSVF